MLSSISIVQVIAPEALRELPLVPIHRSSHEGIRTIISIEINLDSLVILYLCRFLSERISTPIGILGLNHPEWDESGFHS